MISEPKKRSRNGIDLVDNSLRKDEKLAPIRRDTHKNGGYQLKSACIRQMFRVPQSNPGCHFIYKHITSPTEIFLAVRGIPKYLKGRFPSGKHTAEAKTSFTVCGKPAMYTTDLLRLA